MNLKVDELITEEFLLECWEELERYKVTDFVN